MITGFTNGCFDLLHDGHRHFLGCCRELVDRLVVGINTDTSVRRLKGKYRPVDGLQMRIANVWATGLVSQIIPFSEEITLDNIIRDLKPKLYFKGEEYIDKPLPNIWPAMVVFIPMLPNISTTRIIEART